MADVIPHDTADADSPSGARTTALVALLVAAVVFGVAAWTWWVHPRGIESTSVAPAAGVLLAALVLLPPRRWALPVVAAVLGLGIAYFSIYPVGFYVTSLAFAVYLGARLARAIRTRPG